MTKKQRFRRLWEWFQLGCTCAWFFAMAMALAQFSGCAGPGGRLGTVEATSQIEVRATVDSLVKLIDDVSAEVTAIKTGDVAAIQARDITVGGGNDSITNWIREIVLGVLLIGAYGYYPFVHRPVRRLRERQAVRRHNDTQAKMAAEQKAAAALAVMDAGSPDNNGQVPGPPNRPEGAGKNYAG